MDSSIGAGLSTEKAAGAFRFIYPKVAVPGKGTFRTGIHTFLDFTGNTEGNFFFFRPIRMDTDS